MFYKGRLTQGWSRVRSPPCVRVFYCVLAVTWLCLSPRLIRSQCALRWIDAWEDAGRQQLLSLSWADCVVGIQGKGLRKRIPLGRTHRTFTLDGECAWLVNRFLLPLFPRNSRNEHMSSHEATVWMPLCFSPSSTCYATSDLVKTLAVMVVPETQPPT